MRAPQYRKVGKKPDMPIGPNPALAKGLRVEPFAKIYALVDGLSCISLHKQEEEAQAALDVELERRRQSRVVVHDDPNQTPNHDQGAGDE